MSTIPNNQNRTEEVIGTVLQRIRTSHRFFMADSICQGTDEFGTVHQSKKRIRSAKPKDSVKKVKESEDDDTELEAYHRERRRRNQERYRLKQRKLIEDLDEANQKLHDEIERLSRERDSLLCGVSTKETVWSVAVEYFRVFQHGLFATNGLPVVELDFLRATMAIDLDANTVYGFEALARNWKVFTLSFKDVHVRLRRLDQLADDSLLATTTTSITITSKSLRYLFPHLTRDNTDRRKRSRWAHIAGKLVGRRVVVRGTVHFDWNAEDHCVVALITQADMVTPFMQLLGSLEQVSLAFGKALIQPDCNLVIGEHLDKHNLC